MVKAEPAKGSNPPKYLLVADTFRVADADKLGEMVLKAADNGGEVRLKDVAAVELGLRRQSRAVLDGVSVAALAVYPTPAARPRDLDAAVGARLALLRGHFPRGLDCQLAFDFTTSLEGSGRSTADEFLLLDMTPPASASSTRIDDILQRCAEQTRNITGVEHILTLTDHPFDQVPGRPCVLVQLTPPVSRQADRETIAEELRSRLAKEFPQVLLRLRDLSAPAALPRGGYPIDIAISGRELADVRQLADKLTERLRQDKGLTDVWADADSAPRPGVSVDIDRAKALAMGISLKDTLATLEATFGTPEENDLDRLGRSASVRYGLEQKAAAESLKQLKIRSDKGQMVPLSAVAAIRETTASTALDRLDLRPMVEVTANPAVGVTLAQARARCQTLAEEIRKELKLSNDYRLTWLGDW
jgi:multidrug efflux pump subunit AcrB